MRPQRTTVEIKWDAAAEQKRWHEIAARGRPAFEKCFPTRPSADPNYFYDLCLAEVDGAEYLSRQQCFASRSDFIAEVKRLQAAPTTPSIPPFNLQAYQGSQRWWLDFIIESTEPPVQSGKQNLKDKLLPICATALLGMGIFLEYVAMDAARASKFGLAQWQAFVGFLLSFLLFGLLGWWINKLNDATGRSHARGMCNLKRD